MQAMKIQVIKLNKAEFGSKSFLSKGQFRATIFKFAETANLTASYGTILYTVFVGSSATVYRESTKSYAGYKMSKPASLE